jgi:hypothetical protein
LEGEDLWGPRPPLSSLSTPFPATHWVRPARHSHVSHTDPTETTHYGNVLSSPARHSHVSRCGPHGNYTFRQCSSQPLIGFDLQWGKAYLPELIPQGTQPEGFCVTIVRYGRRLIICYPLRYGHISLYQVPTSSPLVHYISLHFPVPGPRIKPFSTLHFPTFSCTRSPHQAL